MGCIITEEGTAIPTGAIIRVDAVEEHEVYGEVKYKWLGFIPDLRHDYIKDGKWCYRVYTVDHAYRFVCDTKEAAEKEREELIAEITEL